MTQSPDDLGGQEDRPPAAVPPPSTWHFPLEPESPPGPAPQAQPNGSQAPYGTSPHYGTPSPSGGLPQYGAPSPGGMTPPPYRAPYGPGYPAYQGGMPGQDADLAEWWRRLLARLIDLVAVIIVLLPVSIPLLSGPFRRMEQVVADYPGLNTPAAQSAFASAEGKFFVALSTLGLIAALVWFVYDSLQHARWGQTLGKRALSTRVVSAYDHSPIGASVAVRRAAVYALIPVIPVAGTFFAVLNYLWLVWDRRRQCLHDKAARTIVVKIAPGAGPPDAPHLGWPPPR